MTRYHDVGQLTTAGLALTMRELRANLSLLTPDSPAHVPILAHMRAIDAELAGRAGNRHPGGGQHHDREILPGPQSEPRYPADRDSNTQGHPAREELEADCGGHPPAGDTPLLGNRAGAAIATGELKDTRIIRLALDSLEEHLPAGLASDGLTAEFVGLRERLAKMEQTALRKIGNREYMILAPVDEFECFGGKAAEALRVLDDLGLVIRLDG